MDWSGANLHDLSDNFWSGANCYTRGLDMLVAGESVHEKLESILHSSACWSWAGATQAVCSKFCSITSDCNLNKGLVGACAVS